MWKSIQTFLENFNTVTGFILFFVTSINLIISWKINVKINSAVDLQRLKLVKTEQIGKIKAVIRSIKSEKELSDSNRIKTLDLLTDIRAKFPDIKKLNKKRLIKDLNSKKLEPLEVAEQLQRLITDIERIA